MAEQESSILLSVGDRTDRRSGAALLFMTRQAAQREGLYWRHCPQLLQSSEKHERFFVQ